MTVAPVIGLAAASMTIQDATNGNEGNGALGDGGSPDGRAGSQIDRAAEAQQTCQHRRERRLFRRVKHLAIGCLLAPFLWPAPEARAAGGAHIIDDSEVEPPGQCHAEFWVTKFVPGDGYGNFAPACTLSKIPTLEFGAIVQHYWDQNTNAPLFGPQVKLNLQKASPGPSEASPNEAYSLGVAIEFNSGVNLRTGALGFASALIPVTIPIGHTTNFNLNAGWSYIGGDRVSHALFYGAQVETKIGFDLTLMIEAFGRTRGTSGIQMGLRYRPNDGPIDFDFLAGSFLDSGNPRFFTVGVTYRW